jgi:hypothetical protein
MSGRTHKLSRTNINGLINKAYSLRSSIWKEKTKTFARRCQLATFQWNIIGGYGVLWEVPRGDVTIGTAFIFEIEDFPSLCVDRLPSGEMVFLQRIYIFSFLN